VNLLAHALLADGTDGSLLGNLIADFLRSPDLAVLPPDVRAGVRLHRHIDAVTDRHPVVHRSIARLGGKWGWFAGILIDVYYDHVLAAEWDRYSDVPLRGFVDHVHVVVRRNADRTPSPAKEVIESFVRSDRLMTYTTPAGIEEALARLSDRIAARMPTRAVRLEQAMPNLMAAHAGLAADFHEFFPQLRAAVADWLAAPTGVT
jgi:acyl carrier protein phosphodiesterase